MREIKFRAWDFTENEMMDTSELPYGVQYNKNKIEIISQKNCFIFMQYTGLKDKNGVEIYEGDIIKGGVYLAYEVKWDCEDNGWNISSEYNIKTNYEVIGNIYENRKVIND